MTELENGEKILHDELTQFLENKRLSTRDKLVLRSLQYILSNQAESKITVEKLTKKSIGLWISTHPQATWGLLVLFIIVQKSLTPILIAFGIPKEVALLIGG